MATDQPTDRLLFSSPTMTARAALVQLLTLVDELERATARADWPAVRRLARQADAALWESQRSLNAAWALADHAHTAWRSTSRTIRPRADGR